jgi:DNA-binding transcriptional regulator YhcF (GntR family)
MNIEHEKIGLKLQGKAAENWVYNTARSRRELNEAIDEAREAGLKLNEIEEWIRAGIAEGKEKIDLWQGDFLQDIFEGGKK